MLDQASSIDERTKLACYKHESYVTSGPDKKSNPYGFLSCSAISRKACRCEVMDKLIEHVHGWLSALSATIIQFMFNLKKWCKCFGVLYYMVLCISSLRPWLISHVNSL